MTKISFAKKSFAFTLSLLLSAGTTIGLTPKEGLFDSLNSFSVSAADSDFTINSKGELTKYDGSGGNIVIPGGVTSIAGSVFKDHPALTGVVIPEGVISIGSEAFYGCTSLKNIELPSTLENIGRKAFLGCKGLKEINLPNEMSNIGSGAFYGCTGITEIRIPEGITTLGVDNATGTIVGMFGNCSSLKSVTLPNSLVTIEGYSFSNCSSLTDIEIPKNVTTIGGASLISLDAYYQNAFENCTSLTNITIPEGVTKIFSKTFINCTALKSIKIPSSVTVIEGGAFKDCKSLTEVEFEEGLISIGAGAFENCSAIKNVKLPDTLASIGSSAFLDCTTLKNVELPKNLVSIGSDAFRNCKSLESIVIPSGITSIPSYAFYGCTALTSIVIPPSVTQIGSSNYSQTTTIYGEKDSYAHEYAIANKYKFKNIKSLGEIIALPTEKTMIVGETYSVVEDEATTITLSTETEVFWSSSNENIATVDENGVVTSVSEGTAVITAITENDTTATMTVIVLSTTIIINTPPEITLGIDEIFVIEHLVENGIGDTVWTSSDDSVATVDQEGVVTAISAGTSTITVENNGVSDTVTVTVKLPTAIEIFSSEITLGIDEIFVIEYLVENGIGDTVWTSSDDSVATVDQEGVVTAISVGTSTITVENNGVSEMVTIEVVPPVIEPDNGLQIEIGTTDLRQKMLSIMKVDDLTGVIWNSGNEFIATIDENGVMTAHGIGTVTITATDSNNPSVTASIDVEVWNFIGILGDVTDSGEPGINDALMIFKHMASIVTLTDREAFLADVSQDGEVGVDDALGIFKEIASIGYVGSKGNVIGDIVKS